MIHMTYTLGIDIGSTTVKVAILDEQHNILFSDYERHFANIRELIEAEDVPFKIKKMINQYIEPELHGEDLSIESWAISPFTP